MADIGGLPGLRETRQFSSCQTMDLLRTVDDVSFNLTESHRTAPYSDRHDDHVRAL